MDSREGEQPRAAKLSMSIQLVLSQIGISPLLAIIIQKIIKARDTEPAGATA